MRPARGIDRQNFCDGGGDREQFGQLKLIVRTDAFAGDDATYRRGLHLRLNGQDELRNLQGGPAGNLPLNDGDLLAALAVAEIDFQYAADNQTAADKQQEHEKILPHQAAAATLAA